MPRTVWNRFFIGMALITSLALLVWIAGASVIAQNTDSGDWTATVLQRQSKIQLNLERRRKSTAETRWDKPTSFPTFRA